MITKITVDFPRIVSYKNNGQPVSDYPVWIRGVHDKSVSTGVADMKELTEVYQSIYKMMSHLETNPRAKIKELIAFIPLKYRKEIYIDDQTKKKRVYKFQWLFIYEDDSII